MMCLCCNRDCRQCNAEGFCTDCATCLHCEIEPTVSRLGLCEYCEAHPSFRRLYERHRGWCPEWEMHLRAMTANETARRAARKEKDHDRNERNDSDQAEGTRGPEPEPRGDKWEGAA